MKDTDPANKKLSKPARSAIATALGVASVIGIGTGAELSKSQPEVTANPLTWVGAPLAAGINNLTGNKPPVTDAGKATQTPVGELASEVAGLQQGKSAEVTAQQVTVPGPVGSAEAQPLVFQGGDGRTYAAYTQGSGPNFQQSPEAVAKSMAIVPEASGVPGEAAHLNKADELVDPNQQAVGFSTGGEQGK